jgi:ABC-type phosphate transport system substrate-binding protein
VSKPVRNGAAGAAALLVLVGCVACGSSSKPSASTTSTTTSASTTTNADAAGATYSLKATQRCLDNAGKHAYLHHDSVVSGTGGGLRVVFGGGFQWIYMVFGQDAKEAAAIRDRAVAATLSHEHGLARKTVLAGVRLHGNVFYYSDGGPVSQVEGSQIESCLR